MTLRNYVNSINISRMGSSIFIIPICSAVVVAGILWLFWLRSGDEH